MIPSRRTSLRQSGISMIEVLVTLVILLVGMLGLAGLMTQSQRSEMESYQRVQAVILLKDMAARITANRLAGTRCYAFTPPAGSTPFLGATTTITTPIVAASFPQCTSANIINDYTSQLNVAFPGGTAGPFANVYNQYLTAATSAAPSAAQTALADLQAWHDALMGAGERSGGGPVGAMLNARGCISYNPNNLLLGQNGTPIPGTGLYTVSIAWQGTGGTYANPSLLCGQNQYLNGTVADDTFRRVASMTFRIGSLVNTQ